MISEVDENMSGSIDFAEFLKVKWGYLSWSVRSGASTRTHELSP